MARFLIDANLPYRFRLWQGPDYVHVFDLNDIWRDSEIWRVDFLCFDPMLVIEIDKPRGARPD